MRLQESKKQFKEGIKDVAKKAEVNNAAWEIVCNASATHETNVRRIEELITQDVANQKVIDELRGFKSQASRIGSEAVPPSKRPRVESEPPSYAVPPIEARTDAWSDFEGMMRSQFRY